MYRRRHTGAFIHYLKVRHTAVMPHKPLSQILDLSSAAGSAQIAVSSQSGDCSVTDEFQSTHLRLTRFVNSELTAACMCSHACRGDRRLRRSQNGRGSQYWWRWDCSILRKCLAIGSRHGLAYGNRYWERSKTQGARSKKLKER